jgi:hypothetical protein
MIVRWKGEFIGKSGEDFLGGEAYYARVAGLRRA